MKMREVMEKQRRLKEDQQRKNLLKAAPFGGPFVLLRRWLRARIAETSKIKGKYASGAVGAWNETLAQLDTIEVEMIKNPK